uniref:Uncharacterized protein n=1 Tax=Panagrolaimus superbus TaxID=310955 RepID=A0A914YSN0_9BILA
MSSSMFFKLFLLFSILQIASAAIDWRKTRPASLLAEVGHPSYTDTVEEDFELAKEPLIIRFDRTWNSSDPNNRKLCIINKDMASDMKPEHQVCFCYYSEGVDFEGADLQCGPNYAILCSTVLYSDYDIFTSGKAINYRTGGLFETAPFTVQEKLSDDGNVVPMIRMKKIYGGCGVIYVENVYKQKKHHELQEIEDYWNGLKCPPCDDQSCEAELDDGINLYPKSSETEAPANPPPEDPAPANPAPANPAPEDPANPTTEDPAP